jgi:hypothetical protein
MLLSHGPRLFSLMVTNKMDFSKVAVYLVSDYVTEVQQVTLLPTVKVSHVNVNSTILLNSAQF